VDDLPTAGELAKDQREQAMRSLPIRHGEMPCAPNEGAFWAKHLDAQDGKLQRPHFMAGTGVGGFIAVKCRLPAAGLFGAGKER